MKLYGTIAVQVQAADILRAPRFFEKVRRMFGGEQREAQPYPKVQHRRYRKGSWEKLLGSHGLQLDDWVCHAWGCYGIQRFWAQGGFCRASDRFARNSAINWLASDQLVCVKAVK